MVYSISDPLRVTHIVVLRCCWQKMPLAKYISNSLEHTYMYINSEVRVLYELRKNLVIYMSIRLYFIIMPAKFLTRLFFNFSMVFFFFQAARQTTSDMSPCRFLRRTVTKRQFRWSPSVQMFWNFGGVSICCIGMRLQRAI